MKESKIYKKSNNAGYVLIFVLIFSIFLLLCGALIGYVNLRTLQGFKTTENAIKALRIAESGLEKVIAKELSNCSLSNCGKYETSPFEEDFAGGFYQVYCNSTSKTITAYGYYKKAKVWIRVSFENSAQGCKFYNWRYF